MARATVIYLVTENDRPVAAFTVKWEMQKWIDQHPGEYVRFRMADGLDWPPDSSKKLPVEMVDE